MKSLALATLAALTLSAVPAQATDIGVSIGISQPGVYGRIDIGRFPQPQVIVGSPVVIRPARVEVAPVYLWVPPGHQKNWGKHCHRYNACGVPVYFVQEDWYRQHVMGDGEHAGKGHGKGRDKDHDRGHGKGHGKGRGHD